MKIKPFLDSRKIAFYNWMMRLSNFLKKRIFRALSISNRNTIFKYLDPYRKYPIKKLNNKLESRDIIWVCWFQGVENAPELVRCCIDSFHRIPEKTVILVDKDNFKNYVSLPVTILNKLYSGAISLTAFSEILRVELLSTYGGMWLDSTMFIPKELKIDYARYKFFSPVEKEKVEEFELFGLFPMFFIYCEAGYEPIVNIRNYILNYWEVSDVQIDYFLIDYFFRYEYLHNEIFRNDVDSLPVLGKNLHSLELYYLDEQYNEKIRVFIDSDSLGIFKLNHKNQHRIFSDNLYSFIVRGDLII